jgi:hypothetical protein
LDFGGQARKVGLYSRELRAELRERRQFRFERRKRRPCREPVLPLLKFGFEPLRLLNL